MSNIVSNNKYIETLSFEEAWNFILKPDLILYSKLFFKKQKFLILVPSLSIVYAFKKKIIENNISLVGVYILTPKQVQEFIIDKFNIFLNNVAFKEDILFLINIINDKLNTKNISSYIFSIYSSILNSGYNNENDLKINKILHKLNVLLKNLKLQTIQDIYRKILNLSLKENKEIWCNSFIWGFDSFYWNYFNLLLSIKNFSTITKFCLINENTLTLESKLWKNIWTNILGSYYFLNDFNIRKNYPYNTLYSLLTSNQSKHENIKLNNSPCFIEKNNIIEEVDAIIEKIINIFEKKKTKFIRIAIVFANKNTVLSKEISLKLSNLNIGHYNNDYYYKENILFHAWLTLQYKQDLNSTIDFIENLFFFKKISLNIKKIIKKFLLKNFSYILDNNIFILLEYSKYNKLFLNEDEYKIFITFFDNWPIFKKHEIFENLLFFTNKVINEFFDISAYEFFKKKIKEYNFLYKEKIKSQFFLYWIKKIIKNYHKKINIKILYPYANIFLLPYKEASLQNWTHIIITENNNEFWRPIKSSLPDEYINKINYKFINKINENFIIKNNYRIINTENNLFKNLENSFYSLIYNCSEKLILTKRKYDLSLTNKNKELTKSIFFDKIYNLYDIKFLEKKEKSYKKKYIIKCLYEKSYLKAFSERRNTNTKMGIYNFILGNKMKRLKFINFNCKDLEYIFKAPELIFFKKILQIQNNYNNNNIMLLSIGSLIHELIYLFLYNNKKIIFTYDDIKQILLLKFNIIYNIYIKNNINIPINFIDFANKTKDILYNLLKNFNNKLIYEYKYFRIEESIIINNSGLPFKIYGRSDLILFTKNPNNIINNKVNNAWIIDFKTGKNKELSLKRLIKGEGIQLLLYAIGLKEKGIKNINISVLNIKDKIKPQINLTNELEKNIINMTNYIYKKGLLGQKGLFNYYPIATIPIEKDIIKQKWKLTHNNIDF